MNLKIAQRLLFSAAMTAASLAMANAAGTTLTDPTGTWSFTSQVRNRTVEVTLVLNLVDDQLSGTIDNPLGKTDISDALFDNGHLSFNVVREIRGRKFVTSYQGDLADDTITGTIVVTNRKGKERKVAWTATRQDADGSETSTTTPHQS